MIPDYAKGKDSAIRILRLNKRQSKIDPNDSTGIVLVSVYLLIITRYELVDFSLAKNDGKCSIRRRQIRLSISSKITCFKRF